MLKLNFTEEDFKVFQYERYHHPHPHVQRKMEVLILKASGLEPTMICKIADVCHKTLCTYINEYNTGGIEKVKEINFYRPKSDLRDHATSIEEYFQKHPPASVAMVSAMIEKLTSIKRGVTQTRTYLKSLGFSFRKTGVVPSKALTEEKKRTKRIFG
jgi:transposase